MLHHTHLILDEEYTPTTVIEKALFQEMQVFMYAVLEEHLKTDKGKSLVSEYETTHDAQSIYRQLKKHARSSTAAQISGDTLLQEHHICLFYIGRNRSSHFELPYLVNRMSYESKTLGSSLSIS
jgi:hypothetical protein